VLSLVHKPAPLVLPRAVQVVVQPAEHGGRVVHRVEVGALVEPAERRGRVLERVHVPHVGGPRVRERLLEGLRRPDVAGARRSGQDEDGCLVRAHWIAGH
jgi:hypothetical protein